MKATNRRTVLKNIAGSALAMGSLSALSSFQKKGDEYNLKGRIKHSVARWTYNHLSLEQLCIAVKKFGLGAIDLVAPKDWPVLQEHNLVCSMCYTAGEVSLVNGFNNKLYHEQLIRDYLEVMPLMVKAGYKNLICFSGNRNGMDNETGLKNCIEGLQKILPLAEKSGIIVQMELFNSKINHPDYMADRSAWGIELCKRLSSQNFKLLYDIYHMQISEGDVIRTIQDHYQHFGHYHTAGVPGRHEIDESQELYYPAIIKAIADTGFTGYLAQEFMPTGKTDAEKMTALKDAVRRCSVG